MGFVITHCICFNRSFAELKAVAEKYQCLTVEELQKHVDFGLNCKLCVPYVRQMLATGETEFGIIIEDP